MIGNLFKKDPEAVKNLPLGVRLLKGCFTSMVSITTGTLADGLFMTSYKAFSNKKTDPPAPTAE